MRAGFAFVICLALVGASAGAQQASTAAGWVIADVRTGQVEGEQVKASDESRAMFVGFTRCLLGRKRGAAEAAMALPPGPAGLQAVSKLVDPDCLNGRAMSMPAEVLRGGLWVARYRRDYAVAAPALAAVPPDFAAGLPDDAGRARTVALRRIADCLLRADPVDARTALTVAIGSSRELEAYGGLQGHLRACSPDRPVRFSKAILAGLLAEVSFIEAGKGGAR